jgi:hypothetical protein
MTPATRMSSMAPPGIWRPPTLFDIHGDQLKLELTPHYNIAALPASPMTSASAPPSLPRSTQRWRPQCHFPFLRLWEASLAALLY